MFKEALAILAATLWSIACEFGRNELLLKADWTSHYEKLRMTFPSAPVNGAVWGLWSLLLVVAVRVLMSRFDTVRAALLAWLLAFVMMWLAIGNLGVMPLSILPWAVPLSLIEVLGVAYILQALRPRAGRPLRGAD